NATIDRTTNDLNAVRVRQLGFTDMVSSQSDHGDTFFGAPKGAIEHVASADLRRPPFPGVFRRSLSRGGERAQDPLTSRNTESQRARGFFQKASSINSHGGSFRSELTGRWNSPLTSWLTCDRNHQEQRAWRIAASHREVRT